MSHYYFSPESREYLPSVTTILQAMLPEPDGIRIWKQRNKNWKKDLGKSSDMGTLIHFALLNPLADHTLDPAALLPYSKWYPDTIQKLELSTMMFEEMLEREHIVLGQPRRVESKIINQKEKYAGQIDLMCPINNIPTLLDIKTSASIRKNHLIQLGGYYMALDEKPEQVGIIKITPDTYKNPSLRGEIHIYPASEARSWGEQFISLARRFHAEGKAPAEEDIDRID
jgi:hypothetical protein